MTLHKVSFFSAIHQRFLAESIQCSLLAVSIYLVQFAYGCLLFGNMFKTEFIKLLQVINTYYLDACVTMLYSAIKVQVHMINTYQGASECASDYHIV